MVRYNETLTLQSRYKTVAFHLRYTTHRLIAAVSAHCCYQRTLLLAARFAACIFKNYTASAAEVHAYCNARDLTLTISYNPCRAAAVAL
jgi:hypothetical protein